MQYVRAVQKQKRAYLGKMDWKMVTAISTLRFNSRAGDNAYTVQRTGTKANVKGFLGLSSGSPWAPLIDSAILQGRQQFILSLPYNKLLFIFMIRRNKIANGGYAVTEMKLSIT